MEKDISNQEAMEQQQETDTNIQERYSAISYSNTSSADGAPRREGHLMVLLPLTKMDAQGERVLEEFRVYNELAAFLAHKHIQKRSGQVLPHLPEYLRGCDFSMTYRHHDSRYSPLQAAKELLTYYNADTNHTHESPPEKEPFAIMGAARSAVSTAVSAVGAALELPQISSSSTAQALDDSPLFARTITGNAAARSMVAYLESLGVTHMGLLFVKDSWGIAYAQNAAAYAQQLGLQVQLVPYNLEDNLDKLLQLLQDNNQLGYFAGAISSSAWKPVIRKLYEHNLIGPSSSIQWFFAEMTELLREGFVLYEPTLARALHGSGVITQKVNPHTAFDRALSTFAKDERLQQEFLQVHEEPDLLDDFAFDMESGRSLFQYLTYDAVIAMGITACKTHGLFTGQEFYDNLLQVDFQGVSGRVQLDPKTGTRTDDAFDYEVINVVLEQPRRGPGFSFETSTSAVVGFPEKDVLQGQVTLLQPFTYYDNTTQAPAILPALNEELNLIPQGVLAIGYGLGALVMVQSIGWALWVYINQEKQVVKAAQPIFLFQLCVGTFLTATAIIPLSFQEDMPGLDQACKATPWFLCTGFCVAVSALLSKSTRIIKLMKSGTGFRRIKVEPVDVMRPFIVLTFINVALLTAWTFSPFSLSWKRKELKNFDGFGRSVESVGLCRPQGNHQEYLAFALPLVLTNAVVLGLAAYRTYQARNLPTDFCEARYLFVSVVSLSETCLLGGTTSLAVMAHPTAFYIVVCIIISLGCVAILLPMFLPKYFRQNDTGRVSVQSTLMDYNVQETIRDRHRGAPSLTRASGVPRGISQNAEPSISELPIGSVKILSHDNESGGLGGSSHTNNSGSKRSSHHLRVRPF